MRCPACFSPVGESVYCAACKRQLRPGAPLRALRKRKRGDTSYLGVTIDRRFRIDGFIGHGLTTAVFVARDLIENRRVALRIVHARVLMEPGVLESFHHEYARIHDLRDPHAIEIHTIGRLPDGVPYIVSELMEGVNLDITIANAAPMPWMRAFEIVAQLCEPLHAAHQRHYVHRRLSPSKIFLETRTTSRFVQGGDPYRDAPVATDFARIEIGGVVAYRPPTPDSVIMNARIGRTEYMSPEHLGGARVDPRSDIFSLGCIAYEMVTGVVPFTDSIGITNRLLAYLTTFAKPPSYHRGVGLPPAAEGVIMTCLSRSPQQRFQHALALRDAMRELLP